MKIELKDQPLTVNEITLIFTRYIKVVNNNILLFGTGMVVLLAMILWRVW